MKKKLLKFCLLFILVFNFTLISEAKAEMPPKVRAFIMVSTYGTVGGALLGFATMAFGSSPRAIAQGASLGLYAGILFGSYVLFSYKKPSKKGEGAAGQGGEYGPNGGDGGYGPEGQDPYGQPQGGSMDPYGPPQDGSMQQQPSEGGGDGFFGFPMRAADFHYDDLHEFEQKNTKGHTNIPSIYLNLLHVTF